MMKYVNSLALVFLTTPAFAHVGNDSAQHHLTAGFNHPFGGLDHCLAMIAVGLVAAFIGGKARAGLPTAFLLAMLVGFMFATTKVVNIPAYEAMIIASVIGLGLTLLIAKPLPMLAAVTMMSVFGLAHGFAHGVEGVLTSSYTVGFLAATAILHGIGLILGFGISKIDKLNLYRISGGGIALAGLALATM